MANRSFIYTTEDIQQNRIKACGLSEYENEVHPLYLLMVAVESQLIFSNVTEEIAKTAIVGNFDEGKDLVCKFLELISTYDEAYQIDAFRVFVTETKEILNQRNVQYVVLENFEIVALSGNNFVPDLFQRLNEIKREVRELCEKHLNGSLSADDLHHSEFYNDFDDVCVEWGELEREDIDWTGFWSETLYYNFQQ